MNFISDIIDLFIPVGICVVLPIMCVWLAMRKQTNDTNKRAEVALEAIRCGRKVDVEDIFKDEKSKKGKKNRTIKEKLLAKLQTACVLLAIGIGLCVFGFINDSHWKGSEVITYIVVLFGLISAVLGLALILVYFVSNKRLSNEMEIEKQLMAAKVAAQEAEGVQDTEETLGDRE